MRKDSIVLPSKDDFQGVHYHFVEKRKYSSFVELIIYIIEWFRLQTARVFLPSLKTFQQEILCIYMNTLRRKQLRQNSMDVGGNFKSLASYTRYRFERWVSSLQICGCIIVQVIKNYHKTSWRHNFHLFISSFNAHRLFSAQTEKEYTDIGSIGNINHYLYRNTFGSLTKYFFNIFHASRRYSWFEINDTFQ